MAVALLLLLGRNGDESASPSVERIATGREGGAPGGLLGETTLIVSPSTVLLTGAGETRRLRATLPGGGDASGVTWHSDNPDAIDVKADGTVESRVALGSAVIRATAGDRQSPPVLVYVAQPVDGAVLVTDEQMEGDPSAAPGAPAGSHRYVVRLRGVDPPAAGTVILATGDAPVGGRVVAAREDGGATEVTLEVIPPEEMFARIEIERVIDLTYADVEISPGILDDYEVRRLPDGTYDFAAKGAAAREMPPSAAVARLAPAAAQQPISQVTRKFEVGPFECETQESASPIALAQPLGFTASPNLSLDLLVRDRLERFVLVGRPRAGVTVSMVANVEFVGKVECKAEVFKLRVPIGGALAYVFGLRVPVGVGMEVEGKITVARLGIEVKGEVGADFSIGVSCEGADGSCSMVNSLELVADGSVTLHFPDPEAQFRVEPGAFAFLFMGGELGSDLLSFIEFELLELKGGLAQEANLAPVSVQIADAGYASSYELKLKGEAEAGQGIDEWLALFRLRTLKIKAEISETLHRSPTGRATADVDEFKAGETVVFEVALEGNLSYPLVGYNVETVSVFRRTGGEVEQVATAVPPDGASSATLRWTADRDGRIGQDFYAFVLTKLLPIPSLEVGAVVAAGGVASGTATPVDGEPPLYACAVFINTRAQGFILAADYADPIVQCRMQLMDCEAGENSRGAAGYHCRYNQDRHLAYILQCGNTPEKQIARGCIAPR